MNTPKTDNARHKAGCVCVVCECAPTPPSEWTEEKGLQCAVGAQGHWSVGQNSLHGTLRSALDSAREPK